MLFNCRISTCFLIQNNHLFTCPVSMKMRNHNSNGETIKSTTEIALKSLRNFLSLFYSLFVELLKTVQILLTRSSFNKGIDRGNNTPIVLIHGLCGNVSNWNLTCRRLEALDCGSLGLFHPLALPLGNQSLKDDLSKAIPFIQKIIDQHSSRQVHLIGHSRGGLVAMLCASLLNTSDHHAVASVVTIASPIKGAPLASWLAEKKIWANLKPLVDLSLESEMVESISKFFDTSKNSQPKTPMLNLVAERDIIVPPENQSYSMENESHSIDAGHLGILSHPSAIKIIYRWLCPTQVEQSRA